ncbi:MAG: YraN family protein [Pseudomonadales bacterium]|jgi:putative endonuclease|nr:YraN family protein [Pseudomonadales bacterium]|tara:strand:+ start:1841 stop:2236 length:396 start_codon:yes stop_codon:yes gene_type:complete
MKQVNGLETGKQAETVALKHLRKNGLTLIERNYRCRLGEIDLIMKHRDLLVFIEVRFRKSDQFGSGAESVDYHKKRKLILTAKHFLALHRRYGKHDCRFDVISASPAASAVPRAALSDMQIEWFQDAFQND